MRVSSLAVFYLWTNVYTVNTRFLTQPFITVYKQSYSRDPFAVGRKHLNDYVIGDRKKHSSASRYLNKHIKAKRFFEFSPLAFDRRKFKKPGDESFIFDSKRFFQYSPFISRLQRSHAHIKTKLESPKKHHKPTFFKPVVDHFSGIQTWQPPPQSSMSSKFLPHSFHGWRDNQNEEPEKEAVNNDELKHNLFKDFERLNSDKLMESNHNIWQNSEPITPLHTPSNVENKGDLQKSILGTDKAELPANRDGWGPETISEHYSTDELFHPDIYVTGQLEHNLDEALDFSNSLDEPDSDSVWDESDMHDSQYKNDLKVDVPSSGHHSNFREGFLHDQPLSVLEEGVITSDFVKDNIYKPNDNDFGAIDTFGSLSDTDTGSFGHGSFGFGDTMPGSQMIDNENEHNFGFWGQIADNGEQRATFDDVHSSDAIPIPGFGSVSEEKQEDCSKVEGKECSSDSECGCFGLYLCIQNSCRSIYIDSEKEKISEGQWSVPSGGVWHDEPVHFPGFT